MCARVYARVCEGRRCVRQGDSDRSAGHVWAAVMDASVTAISKAFQGRQDGALCCDVPQHFLCVSECVFCAFPLIP